MLQISLDPIQYLISTRTKYPLVSILELIEISFMNKNKIDCKQQKKHE